MKQKTKKAAAKRFKITKTGKVLRGHQYSRHLKLHKSKARQRRQKEPGEVTGRQAIKIKRLLPYA